MYIRCTGGGGDFRPQKLLKHPQNPYSIERACYKLSETPSHALIVAVGGSEHHSECATRALSGPNRTRRGKAGPSSGGGGWDQRPETENLLPPDEA